MNEQNDPYFDPLRFEAVHLLLANFEQIKAECDSLFSIEGPVPKINALMEGQDGRNPASTGKPKYEGLNSSLHLRVVPDLLDPPEARVALTPAGEAGREARRRKCPIVMRCLEPWLEHVGNIGFNRLFPGAYITPHYGVLTARSYVRVHLGLSCDPRATFHVQGGPDYVWTNGGVMGFHDGTVLHWVTHEGIAPRTILSIDFKKHLALES
jgi:hypothetical protein